MHCDDGGVDDLAAQGLEAEAPSEKCTGANSEPVLSWIWAMAKCSPVWSPVVLPDSPYQTLKDLSWQRRPECPCPSIPGSGTSESWWHGFKEKRPCSTTFPWVNVCH
ncbi:hypothetical protein NCCP2145_12050 [Pseudarthrobacter sp. NCCP-2145]|nr:hypothetical protein NCCP2145_12050 [Pseudarthrobacter sp. NCCP-2145]